MATNNPHLIAIREALGELRRAPLLDKAPKAETVATLTISLLAEFDRRMGALEARETERAAHCSALHDRLDAIERELRSVFRDDGPLAMLLGDAELERPAPPCDCKDGRECNRRPGCGLERVQCPR